MKKNCHFCLQFKFLKLLNIFTINGYGEGPALAIEIDDSTIIITELSLGACDGRVWCYLEGIPAGAMSIDDECQGWSVHDDPALAGLIPPWTDRSSRNAQVGFDEQLICILKIWRTVGSHRRFVRVPNDGD